MEIVDKIIHFIQRKHALVTFRYMTKCMNSTYIKVYDHVLEFFIRVRVRVMVFYVTFNNISVISWRSTLLVKETG
jgi:hypothetical protein